MALNATPTLARQAEERRLGGRQHAGQAPPFQRGAARGAVEACRGRQLEPAVRAQGTQGQVLHRVGHHQGVGPIGHRACSTCPLINRSLKNYLPDDILTLKTHPVQTGAAPKLLQQPEAEGYAAHAQQAGRHRVLADHAAGCWVRQCCRFTASAAPAATAAVGAAAAVADGWGTMPASVKYPAGTRRPKTRGPEQRAACHVARPGKRFTVSVRRWLTCRGLWVKSAAWPSAACELCFAGGGGTSSEIWDHQKHRWAAKGSLCASARLSAVFLSSMVRFYCCEHGSRARDVRFSDRVCRSGRLPVCLGRA